MDEGALVRSWTHAPERDEGGRMVFLPSDSPDIKPSRAPRTAFDLAHGGELTTYSPGPDDRRTGGAGRWRVEGRHLVLEPGGGAAQRYVVDEASADRLVLRSAD